MTPNESPAALLPTIDELTKRQAHDDPVFAAWRDSVPDKHWVKIDLSALRIGYELGRAIASTAPGASESRGSVPDGWVLVPKDALDWLFGEAGIFECPPSSYFHGKPPTYWWRSEFRKRIAAAPTPPAVANGEPTAEHWKEAIMLWYAKPRAGLAWDWIESVAYQLLARSAAAKGEG